MTTTGMDVFDTTVQKTMLWLKEIDEDLGWEGRRTAYQALRACLHEVRDRLPLDVMSHLAAELPLLVRGIYFEGWDPSHAPKGRSAEDFINDFISHSNVPWRSEDDFEAIARACLGVLSRHIDSGMVERARHTLPHQISELWPAV